MFSPFFRAVGALTPYPGNDIPVDVILTSDKTSPIILMHRIFYYKKRLAYHFYSKMILIKDNIIIKLTRFRIAIKLLYLLENNKMDYGGYVLYLGKWLIPIPLQLILAGPDKQNLQLLKHDIEQNHPNILLRLATFDINIEITEQLQKLKPFIVINTCGPFQKNNYNVALASIILGIHYIDLADCRRFVSEFATNLNNMAEQKNV
ncbi:MAG: hypothetical protein O7C59_07000 [Rickettsia endosymbiont of Ixodes persulcatus]|nr:hypothetical protein [Rickettsia endosymbiont of Ixodes persulcatus]MCZ6902826.1 hypothetical protein [Rickettsia endosymbiont of Ixodes persulcatus]MCZ6909012.1 hypothetical protein [Rickettsia endosymbiont of Ixodes persulcatus]MCZ6910680.1 hypothetical protein [Rickettsia endosymbiont of Ixodes persulcatus]MCZ6914210.1 hypothetical protein [Rickettsia endosymbiont of Ixodes persulcatus]